MKKLGKVEVFEHDDGHKEFVIDVGNMQAEDIEFMIDELQSQRQITEKLRKEAEAWLKR